MIDILNPKEVVQKTTDITIKTLDHTNNMFKENMKFVDSITNKFFYTYTVQAAEAVNKVTEYAKETITNQKVANIFSTGK